MKNRNKGQSRVHSLYRRIACFFFAFIMMSTIVMMNSNTSLAANKETTSKAIAIVFDNSGSMYTETAWSRAIYAMEVFASMANEGDQISIYPMNPIEVDDKTYTSDSPLELKGGEDVSSEIRHIVTPDSGDTPIEAITSAYDGLTEMTADEKWLIVLTDGDKKDGFYEDGKKLETDDSDGENSKDRLSKDLTEYSKYVNVMYLGIGKEKEIIQPDINDSPLQDPVRNASDSGEILKTLTEMCNDIYGRDELELSSSNDANSYPVTFDISMTKLILFVQGDNIENLSLVDENGKEVETAFSTISPKYPDAPGSGSVKEGSSYYENNDTDKSLSGQIATYENVPAGTYTMEFDGNSSDVAVYYEPNASISAFLTDENGTNVMDLNEGEIYPGTYQLEYGLVDEDENLTDSKLLGDRKFTITYSVNGEKKTKERDDNGSIQIELAAGDQIDVHVDATYLKNYHDSTDSLTRFPFPITISETPKYDLSAEIEADSSYVISDLNDGKADPIVVNVTYNGEKLTPEEMENVKMTLTYDDLNKEDWVEKDSENSGYLIHPKVDTEDAGTHTITADVTYTDEYGEEIRAPQSVKSIEFSRWPLWVRWVIIGVILLIILAIILFILNQKVLPKKIIIDKAASKLVIDGEWKDLINPKPVLTGSGKGSLEIKAEPGSDDISKVDMSVKMEVKAVDPRRTRSSSRGMLITKISGIPNSVNTVKVGAAEFNRENDFKRTGKAAEDTSKCEIKVGKSWSCVLIGVKDDTSYTCTYALKSSK